MGGPAEADSAPRPVRAADGRVRGGWLHAPPAAADGERYLTESFRDRLPKADIGKSCVRFKRLADLDRDTLVALIREGAKLDGRKLGS